MEKIKIEREVVIFDIEERKKLIACLDYCYHRMTEHPECRLLTQVNVTFVEYMRDNL